MSSIKLQEIANTFHVPYPTLVTWSKKDNRKSYVTFLDAAFKRVEDKSIKYDDLKTMSNTEAAKKLGFNDPLTLDGVVPSRTFRNWFNDPDKQGLVLGMLIGYQTALLNDLAINTGHNNLDSLLSTLSSKLIEVNDIVSLLLVSNETVCKLLKH
ncbi:hypothetical protein [Pseudoalteromonas sp. TAB23]|uniref:hypothetical protein n=1 Tax=Pseudoalteromonas sp. TAB23 TaxID=1938595 RepID=UPI00041E330E|nr:hypothetical protein [Pseudoalteromonas sp. TAB23]